MGEVAPTRSRRAAGAWKTIRLWQSQGASPASAFSRCQRSVSTSSKAKPWSANRRIQNDLGWQLTWQSPAWPGPAAVRQMCLRAAAARALTNSVADSSDVLGDLEAEDQVGIPG